jgi:hypothetical protein
LRKIKFISTIAVFIFFANINIINAQAFQGFTLFAPNNGKNSYLYNMSNTITKTWTHTIAGGYATYLMEDGTIMRTANSSNSSLNGGGATGIVQKIDWNGNIVWQYTYSSSTYRSHHDICPMPNGNVLLIAWEVKSAAQCVTAGLNHSSSLWPDHIIEVQPTGTSGGNIVWEWHVWDHLIQDYNSTKSNYGVVGNHPELLDINVGSTSGDWMHFNGLSYNPGLDQIVFSSHNLDEIYVIDHSTTTSQSAGHIGGKYGKGGDFLYRWGRPSNYRAPGSQIFDVVHSAMWIPKGYPGEGNILAFNNRETQSTSVVVQLVPPEDSAGFYKWTPGSAYGPTAPVWSYTKTGFYSMHLGGVQRLSNGNTMIAQSTSGYLFEVDANGNTVWSYSRGGEIVKVFRYAANDPGLRILNSPEIVINEFSVLNDSIQDPTGQYSGWIELYNNTSDTITLSGRYLSNDIAIPKKWSFPIGTRITPNGYLIVWANSTVINNSSFCNFNLTGSGGKLLLSNIDLTIIDSVSYGAQQQNISFARIPNGIGGFINAIPTFKDSNKPLITYLQDYQLLYAYQLKQNYPNPFNPSTTIEYSIPEKSLVRITVYDILGKEVSVILNEIKDAGQYKSLYNAAGLSSGIYICKIVSGNFNKVIKLMLVK